MELTPIASFPFLKWAEEVGAQLQRAALAPVIEARGPRAYQISVPQDQAKAAEEILGALGYLTCEIR